MSHTKPARAGKKHHREEKNPGIDARDSKYEPHQKPAPGLRDLRGVDKDGHLCHCVPPKA